jgi:hypothetical protein
MMQHFIKVIPSKMPTPTCLKGNIKNLGQALVGTPQFAKKN